MRADSTRPSYGAAALSAVLLGATPSGSTAAPTMPFHVDAPKGTHLLRGPDLAPTRSDWLADAEAQLRRMETRSAQGDAETGSAPNAAALEHARRALDAMHQINLAPKKIVATGEGGVAVCFSGGSRYADVEFSNTGEIVAITKGGPGGRQLWAVGDDSASLIAALRRIQEFMAA